ncbi:MAG TPA: hypothetical protein VEN28_06235 [Burkholderiaceae bacterium]|jgi:hypothetical protein|nr:hypothetical protein [Burkholderiaceae bacterium]
MTYGTNSATPSGAAPTAQAASQQAPKGANGSAPQTIGQKVMRGATVAVAIAIGATGGTFSAIGFLEYTQLTQVTEAAPMPTLVDETRAVWSAVTQLQNDIAVLKFNTESTPRTGSSNSGSNNTSASSTSAPGQISHLNERFDRIERRIDALATKDTTGTVPAAPTQKIGMRAPLAGWSVRDVYRNAALIQGTKLGMMEVSPGDNIPGLGRIHSIRQQDGRWVVVTSRGIIAQPR